MVLLIHFDLLLVIHSERSEIKLFCNDVPSVDGCKLYKYIIIELLCVNDHQREKARVG